MTLRAIWAQSHNRIIGKAGGLPWLVPEDLAYFRRVTLGDTVIMGRATWESLGGPLEGRDNIVVRSGQLFTEGAAVANSLDQAVRRIAVTPDQWVIGGEALFLEAMRMVSQLHVCEVDVHVDITDEDDFRTAPPIALRTWRPQGLPDFRISAKTGLPYRHLVYDRYEDLERV